MKTDDILIHPSKLFGEIDAISSKSFAHRALIMAGLSKNPTNIYINEFSKDINVTIDSLENLGVKIKKDKNLVKITPPNKKIEKATIDMYESGSSLRFFTGVCSHFSKNTKIIGENRLGQRPNLELINNLRKHGLEISSDKIPYTIKGELKGGDFEFLENKSSQYITAIMLAASKLDGKTYIELNQKPESIGYIDITRKVLKDFNVDVKKENKEIKIDISQIPDLCPIIAVLLTFLDKPSFIINGKRLRLKESDRLESTSKMLNDLGANCQIIGDGLKISGKINGGQVDSFNDHRIVMAASIGSLLAKKNIIIKNYKAVDKSYPSFFKTFEKLGGKIEYLGA